MFAGLMSGYGEASHEHNKNLMDIEIESRKGLVSMYQTLSQDPNVPPELKQKFLEFAIQIPQLPYDKKLPKQFTDMGAIMKQRQQIPPTTPPAPGSIPAQPGEVPSPIPTPQSIYYGREEQQRMAGQASEAQTATEINAAQQMQRAGFAAPGMDRDVQDPLILPPGSSAVFRDPSGQPTGETLQAPFKPDTQPQLSATDQQSLFAYAQRNRKLVHELDDQEIMTALAEGRDKLRGESNRLVPVITKDPQNNDITLYLREGDVEGKSFIRPGGSQGSEYREMAGKIYPRLKELVLGSAASGIPEGSEGFVPGEGVFSLEGPAARIQGWGQKLLAVGNLAPDFQEYLSSVVGFIPVFAKAIGHTGVLTELDVQKTIGLFPVPGDSRELSRRKLVNIERLMMNPTTEDRPAWLERDTPNEAQGLTNEELLFMLER